MISTEDFNPFGPRYAKEGPRTENRINSDRLAEQAAIRAEPDAYPSKSTRAAIDMRSPTAVDNPAAAKR